MSWETSPDAGEFLERSADFLSLDPVRNTLLLTEAHFWRNLSTPPPGARFGWWVEAGRVGAAFVEVPDHDPICSPLTPASAAALPDVLREAARVGIEEGDVPVVADAWLAAGWSVSTDSRVTLLRLRELRERTLPEGRSRTAALSDLPVLRGWFRLFQSRFPADPSHVEFVIDQPLSDGAVVLWEVGGHPVAMASRTPVVESMVRMGLAFQPEQGTRYADAAFVVACAEAARIADQVLVMSGDPETTAHYESWGFAPVLARVMMRIRGEH